MFVVVGKVGCVSVGGRSGLVVVVSGGKSVVVGTSPGRLLFPARLFPVEAGIIIFIEVITITGNIISNKNKNRFMVNIPGDNKETSQYRRTTTFIVPHVFLHTMIIQFINNCNYR
jgi:hypothetical protein